jgi:uncharacterized protein YggU (UPF0235/DUF167 family)
VADGVVRHGLVRRGADLLVDVRLTPRADRDRIDGPMVLADGHRVLALRVRAVPEDGRANDAAIALLAAAAGVKRTAVSIETGGTSRRKTLRVAGADAGVEAALSGLFGQDP